MPASPRPLGSGAKYKTRITNTEWGGGSGKSINCVGQGQAPLIGSHSHPEFSKVQIVKIYNPSGLLAKITSHVPNEPRVKRQLEGQQQSEKRQVEMVREKTEGERPSRKRQQETGRRDRLPRSFQKQCFQFNGMALGANVTWAKAAEALTLSRARAHTHPYIIYLFIHNRYKCLSETRKGINNYREGRGQGRRRRTGHVECSPCSRRAAWPTRH